MSAQRIPSHAPTPPPHLRGLLVEDDDVDAQIVALMTAMMSGYDLTLLRVGSVAAAQAAIREETFDLYLVNSWLGDVAALRFAQAHEATARPAGVIMLSNIRRADADSLNLRATGAVFLSKPSLSPERLELAIDKALSEPSAPLN
jgi:DNA-binding NtrC family response regulator